MSILVTIYKIKSKVINYAKYYFNKRYVYFTFDDGPCGGSQFCLKFCNEHGIPASFFWIGTHYNNLNNKYTYLELLKENIKIYNHTYSHAANVTYKGYYNNENVIKDLKINEEVLNLNNKYCRLPGRNVWALPNNNLKCSISMREITQKIINDGYEIWGWDIEWLRLGETIENGHAKIFMNRIIQKIKHGRTYKPNRIIILFHDWSFNKNKIAENELRDLYYKLKKKRFLFMNLNDFK